MIAGFSPLVYTFVVEMSYTHGVFVEDIYLRVLSYGDFLMYPGILIPSAWGYEPYFWVPHSKGIVFVKDLISFVVFNVLGWILFFYLLDFALINLKKSSD